MTSQGEGHWSEHSVNLVGFAINYKNRLNWIKIKNQPNQLV